jgi:hypothetical protein
MNRFTPYFQAALLVIGILVFGMMTAYAQTVTTTPSAVPPDGLYDLYRGTTIVTRNIAGHDACVMAAKANTLSRAAGANYSCRSQANFATVFAPGLCPARPADETRLQTCAAPAIGSWTQTLIYVSAPQPTCWTAGAWLPALPPVGACVTASPSTITMEAESGTVSGGANKQNVGSPASGEVIVGAFTQAGAALTLSVSGGGARLLQVRYANQSSTSSIGVYVNGVRQATLGFPSTGGWMTFANSGTVPLTFASGTNALMFRLDASDVAAVDIDTITLSASSDPPPPPALGTASLSWTPSTDARSIGYRVYYGSAPGVYLQAKGFGVLVNGAASAAALVSNLAAGTHYFAVTAISSTEESAYSNEASKTIP